MPLSRSCQVTHHPNLTQLDIEILQNLAIGLTNEQIAREMHYTRHYMDSLIRQTRLKLGAATNDEAVAIYDQLAIY